MLIAAIYFDLRLPETFAGFPIEGTAFPAQYPSSCSPQAWATGAPLLGLRVLLGLEPEGDKLRSEAVLPPSISHIEIGGIPGRWGRTDVVGHSDSEVDLWQVWYAARDSASGSGTAPEDLRKMLHPFT